MNTTDRQAEIDRLRWQCRRGLLELDLLFEAFLAQGYADLPEADRVIFQELLEYQDQQLQEWLLGKTSPEDAAIQRMVGIIRKAI